MKTLRFTCSFFVFIVGVGVVIALSNPPTPTPPKGANDYQSFAQREENLKKSEEKTPQDDSALHFKRDAVVTGRQQKQQSGGQENDTPSQWWTIWPNIIMAVFTAVLTFVSIGQWRIARDALTATTQSAQAAESAAATAKRTLILSERPYPVIMKAAIAPSHRIEPKAELTFTIQNCGRTIAKNLRASVSVRGTNGGEVLGPPVILPPSQLNHRAIPVERIFFASEQSGEFERLCKEGGDMALTVIIDFDDIHGGHPEITYTLLWDGKTHGFSFASNESIG